MVLQGPAALAAAFFSSDGRRRAGVSVFTEWELSGEPQGDSLKGVRRDFRPAGAHDRSDARLRL